MRFRSKKLMITILLVDHATENSRSVRESLAVLRKNNFRLDRVRSYREILKGFRSRSYDVCLIDSGFGNGLKLFSQPQDLFGGAHLKDVDSATETQFIYSFDSPVNHPFQADT